MRSLLLCVAVLLLAGCGRELVEVQSFPGQVLTSAVPGCWAQIDCPNGRVVRCHTSVASGARCSWEAIPGFGVRCSEWDVHGRIWVREEHCDGRGRG